MPWLKSGRVVEQEDDASPYTERCTNKRLNGPGKDRGWDNQPVTKSAQAPDLDMIDLGFLESMESRVRRERFGTIDDLVDGAQRLLREYDS